MSITPYGFFIMIILRHKAAVNPYGQWPHTLRAKLVSIRYTFGYRSVRYCLAQNTGLSISLQGPATSTARYELRGNLRFFPRKITDDRLTAM